MSTTVGPSGWLDWLDRPDRPDRPDRLDGFPTQGIHVSVYASLRNGSAWVTETDRGVPLPSVELLASSFIARSKPSTKRSSADDCV
jgi:hypothetical protein